jgi:hypothetical protein
MRLAQIGKIHLKCGFALFRGLFRVVERRARDSNPGGAFLPLALFKTAAIGH